jgi:hypothetical protein
MMDDLERELILLDMADLSFEYDKSRKEEIEKNPVWWNIRLGLIESTEDQYKISGIIFSEFMKLKSLPDEPIEHKFSRFSQLKIAKDTV